MCLIAVAYRSVPGHELVALANRDEFYARPSAPLHLWPAPSAPRRIAGGRDLQAGGTWLAVASDHTGTENPVRFAAVTNFRNPDQPVGLSSRGELVTDFLEADADAAGFAAALSSRAMDYAGYNLLLFDASGLFYATNRQLVSGDYAAEYRKLEPGIYALSNALLDSPWPKAMRLTAEVAALAAKQRPGSPVDSKRWLDLMLDSTEAPIGKVPQTGIPLELEQKLSSTFIALEGYGTRCTTLLTMPYAAAGSLADISAGAATPESAELIERRFGPEGYQDTSSLRLGAPS